MAKRRLKKTNVTWKEAVLYVIAEIEEKRIGKRSPKFFKLDDVYSFEWFFEKYFPDNKNIKAKIRQTLQFLRDEKFIKFIDQGTYQKTPKGQRLTRGFVQKSKKNIVEGGPDESEARASRIKGAMY